MNVLFFRDCGRCLGSLHKFVRVFVVRVVSQQRYLYRLRSCAAFLSVFADQSHKPFGAFHFTLALPVPVALHQTSTDDVVLSSYVGLFPLNWPPVVTPIVARCLNSRYDQKLASWNQPHSNMTLPTTERRLG